MVAPALERCVGDPRAFIRDVWAKTPAHYPASDPHAFEDLLTLDDVDLIVSSMALRLPTFRLIKDGATLPESTYTKSGRAGSKPMTGLADPIRIFGLFDQGATIVLQGMHRFWPPLARFCRELEIALGHPAQVNAYITPPGSQGLAVHEDPHDVFVLQAFGSKHWDVWPTRTPEDGDRAPSADGPPIVSAQLGPGDVVYMPRRTPHSARTQEALSGHLTVGVPTITWRELLKRPVQRALEGAVFDETLPAGYHRDRDRFARELDTRLSEAVRSIEKTDPVEAADAAIDLFLSSRPPLLRGTLISMLQLDALHDGSMVRPRDASVCELRAEPGRLTVLLGDRALRMPSWCEPAMQAIARAGEPFRIGDLHPHLDGPGRLVLVRRLVREGMLEVVGGG